MCYMQAVYLCLIPHLYFRVILCREGEDGHFGAVFSRFFL